jgi:tetratricopeptide (TPR) repeat protein
LALAAAGDVPDALETARQLDRQFPLNTLIQRCELPTIRAQIYLQQDNPGSAIEILRQATSYELRYSDTFGLEPAYVRGEAYLQARQAQQAATEFRKVLEHRGIVGNSINGALAHLQLGRAQVMMDDKTAARKSYQDFLTLWKDADPDIPIYKQAKAEYAKLQ